MSPVSRRIFLYWVLLLVPTLVVGGGALVLLQREQERIVEQGAYAEESRRAAIAARARLIAENVELLVGDVQTGLLETLAGENAPDIDRFMDQWERTNPLVRTAFRVSIDGRVLRPDAASADEETRGFLRRFERTFRDAPPWSTESPPAPAPGMAAAPETKREQDEARERKNVSSNVAQVQSARRDVQELFKARDLSAGASARAASSSGALADAGTASPKKAQTAATQPASARRGNAPAAEKPVPAVAGVASSARNDGATRSERAETVTAKQAASRRGWWPIMIAGRQHLLAWVVPPAAREIRGAEVETAALISRLDSALPAAPADGEGFVLQDPNGQIVHQTGLVPRSATAAVRVPLAEALLPGWSVHGVLSARPATSVGGRGVFWLGMLLVGIFVAAILAGGSLLLWQARRSEQEAVQQTSFVANVSHEFKTPLTTIRLYSELLEQGRVRDAEQERDYLRTIGRETQRLARLVNNALDFSRLEQGQKKYAHETIDLGSEMARLLDTHAPRVAEAGLTLQRAMPASSVVVSTDRDALEQIVLNLIDNACKYAARGGEISVSVGARPAGGADVRVSDRGPGVPAEHRERIFEKFQRVDDALTAEKTGTGLGLSIARQLARGLGGELRCVAREGGGGEFVLELP